MRRTSGGGAARAWRHVRVGLAAEAADAARRIMCRRCRRCAQTRRPSLFSLFSLPSSFLSSFAAVPQDCNARLQCKTAEASPLAAQPRRPLRSEARRGGATLWEDAFVGNGEDGERSCTVGVAAYTIPCEGVTWCQRQHVWIMLPVAAWSGRVNRHLRSVVHVKLQQLVPRIL